jgi:hypothetical protein
LQFAILAENSFEIRGHLREWRSLAKCGKHLGSTT